MHIIIGIAAVLVLLYFWLLGHWLARIELAKRRKGYAAP